MILSKGNLQAIQITKKDSKTPLLDNLIVMKEGITIAFSRSGGIAVGPVEEKLKKQLPFDDIQVDNNFALHSSTVEDIIKNISKDTLFEGRLEHCSIDSNGTIRTHDGKREKVIYGKKQEPHGIGKFLDIFRRILSGKKTIRVVLNASRFRLMLNAIEAICGDSSGELLLYIEFGENHELVVRAVHPRFSQYIVGIMATYKGFEGKWLPESELEKRLSQKPKLRVRLK